MPDGFNTYWVNKYNGNYPYMDMLINEMVPAVDAKFRTLSICRNGQSWVIPWVDTVR